MVLSYSHSDKEKEEAADWQRLLIWALEFGQQKEQLNILKKRNSTKIGYKIGEGDVNLRFNSKRKSTVCCKYHKIW
jgi:hypothetical protein